MAASMPPETPGDDEAQRVAELFEQQRGPVYAYLVRMVRDVHLAEELTQEAFLKVYQARGRLPEIENPRAWVFRVATNACLTALKRSRRFRWLPWEAAEGFLSGRHDAIEQVGQRDAVEQALASLSEEYRAPLLLFSHYGFHVAEIAEMLGISEGAVKTRVYRAKEMFMRAYQQGEGREGEGK